MFGLGMTEMIVIGAIALLVVGPKDLPKVFKGIASLMKQVRKLTREFQGVVSDMIRESDLDDLRKEASDLRKSMDPTSEIREAMKDVESDMRETTKAVDPETLFQPSDTSDRAAEAAAPTTSAPTTSAPTTSAPATSAPTTSAPAAKSEASS